jgi:hypothetical protein
MGLSNYLTGQMVADRWGICMETLANWRHRKVGPKYEKLNHVVLYDIKVIKEFEANHLIRRMRLTSKGKTGNNRGR